MQLFHSNLVFKRRTYESPKETQIKRVEILIIVASVNLRNKMNGVAFSFAFNFVTNVYANS